MGEPDPKILDKLAYRTHSIESLIKDLLLLLDRGHSGDTPVIIATDIEGHHCSPLIREEHANGVSVGMYAPRNPWAGEHYMTESERAAHPDADEYTPAPPGAVEAVFLWPTN